VSVGGLKKTRGRKRKRGSELSEGRKPPVHYMRIRRNVKTL
jgi:hypothetical protein